MLFFGSLLPVALVDGGPLLKWTLVDKGWAEEQADRQVRQASIGVGIGLAVTAVIATVGFLVKRRREL